MGFLVTEQGIFLFNTKTYKIGKTKSEQFIYHNSHRHNKIQSMNLYRLTYAVLIRHQPTTLPCLYYKIIQKKISGYSSFCQATRLMYIKSKILK